MEAFKCDRCGQYYMPHDYTTKAKINRFHNKDKKDKPDELYHFRIRVDCENRYYSGASAVGTMDDNLNWDICPKCAEKILGVIFESD